MSYQVGGLNPPEAVYPWFYLKREAIKHILETLPELGTYGIWDENSKLVAIVCDGEVFNLE